MPDTRRLMLASLVFAISVIGASLSVSSNATASPPTTNADIVGEHGMNDWFTSDVTIYLNASDIDGVLEVVYRIDDQPWVHTAGEQATISLSNDGDHQIWYYSNDSFDEMESEQYRNVKIDKSAPDLNLDIWDGKVYNSSDIDIQVLQCDDVTSGISTLEYQVNMEPYQPVGGGDIYINGLNDGHHSISIRATDNAGLSNTQNFDFEIDTGSGGNGGGPPEMTEEMFFFIISLSLIMVVMLGTARFFIREKE